MNLRLNYAETVARPTYRELAPYEAYDPFGDEIVRGNPNLQMSAITNYDARWEWFPSPARCYRSAGGFYKDLKDPIEKQIVTFGGGIVGFENRAEATVYGRGVRGPRKSMDFVDELLADFSARRSISPTSSPRCRLTAQEKINDPAYSLDPRPLYDQSEWIANADFSSGEPAPGARPARWRSTGPAPRIYLVDVGGPDVYEHPPMLIDLIVSQKLSDHWRRALRRRAICSMRNIARPTARTLTIPSAAPTRAGAPTASIRPKHPRLVVFGLQAVDLRV